MQHDPTLATAWQPHSGLNLFEGMCKNPLFIANILVWKLKELEIDYEIMAEEDPVFENFDGDDWMVNHYDPNESLDTINKEFQEQCRSTADWLVELSRDSWNRSGIHPTIGNHTMQWWVERTLTHNFDHLLQLEGSTVKPS